MSQMKKLQERQILSQKQEFTGVKFVIAGEEVDPWKIPEKLLNVLVTT